MEESAIPHACLTGDTENPSKLSIGFDYRKYEHFLENSDLTDLEKEQVINSLWTIISSFIQLGFGIHPVQLALEYKGSFRSCGQMKSHKDKESPDLVFCKEGMQQEAHIYEST